MELLWLLAGAALIGVGFVRVVAGVSQFFGGHPDVAVTRHLSRGTMFLVYGAVIVLAAWQTGFA